jgi:hypothetical protein
MSLLSVCIATGRAFARFARGLVEERIEFTCGQCDRNARCGLAPNQPCVYRLMRIAELRTQPARWPARPFGMR